MKKQTGSSRDEAGQTLLEILLAFGVSILVLSAIILGITTSLNNAQYTKNQSLANSYAQEGMAVVRQIRDSSWYDFSQKTDLNYCIGQNPTKLASRTDSVGSTSTSCGQNVGIFSREATIVHSSAGCSGGSQVAVKVSWADGKCPVGNSYCHSVELISCFTNIDQKSNP